MHLSGGCPRCVKEEKLEAANSNTLDHRHTQTGAVQRGNERNQGDILKGWETRAERGAEVVQAARSSQITTVISAAFPLNEAYESLQGKHTLCVSLYSVVYFCR